MSFLVNASFVNECILFIRRLQNGKWIDSILVLKKTKIIVGLVRRVFLEYLSQPTFQYWYII